jgi:hypothetical protein
MEALKIYLMLALIAAIAAASRHKGQPPTPEQPT